MNETDGPGAATLDGGGEPQESTPGPRFSIPRSILYTLVIWTVLLAALEGILRIVGLGPPGPGVVSPRNDIFRSDPDLIWALKEEWRGFQPNNVPVTISRSGTRGADPRPGAELSILFLGDSVTFGHFIGDDEAVPARLEARLAAASGKDVQVINAGVPGYSTFQEEAWYRLRGRLLAPDFVLLGFCLNDVMDRYYTVSDYGGTRFFMVNVDTEAHLAPWRRLWRSSAIREGLYALVRHRARRQEMYRVQSLWTRREEPHIRAAWSRMIEEADRLIDTVRGDGRLLVVVLYPYRAQLEAPLVYAPQDELIRHLRDREVPYVNLLSSLPAAGHRPEEIFMDNNHFTPRGADVVAGILASSLEREGLLERSLHE